MTTIVEISQTVRHLSDLILQTNTELEMSVLVAAREVLLNIMERKSQGGE